MNQWLNLRIGPVFSLYGGGSQVQTAGPRAVTGDTVRKHTFSSTINWEAENPPVGARSYQSSMGSSH